MLRKRSESQQAKSLFKSQAEVSQKSCENFRFSLKNTPEIQHNSYRNLSGHFGSGRHLNQSNSLSRGQDRRQKYSDAEVIFTKRILIVTTEVIVAHCLKN